MRMKRFLSMLLAATMILASGIFISMTNMGSTIVEATDSGPAKGDFTISGEKVWNDNDDEVGARPESVEIILYKNGTKIGTKTTSASENWQFKFDLVNQSYNAEYTIDEEPIENYEIEEIVNPEITYKTFVVTGWKKHSPNNELVIPTNNSSVVVFRKGGETFVWTATSLEEEDKIKQAIYSSFDSNMITGKTTLEDLSFHFGDDLIFSHNGQVIISSDSITFSDPSDWSLVWFGEYFLENLDITESSITNTYVAPDDSEEPGTEEPGTEEPGTEEPGTEEPGTEEPGTEEPNTEEPSETPEETVEPPVEEIITEPTTSETTSVTTVPASTTEPEFPHTGESGTPLWIPLLLAFTGIGSTIGAVVVRRKIY